MSNARPSERGFTLTEILVVVALLSVAAISIAHSFQGLIRTNAVISNRQREVDTARIALERFTYDIRRSRAVLLAKPERIALWMNDTDSDHVPSEMEVVTYDFDARSTAWRRASSSGEEHLVNLVDLQVGVDSTIPFAKHLVINIAHGSTSDSHWLGSSVSLREDYRAPQSK